jgi:predicted 3-demethylubiquinone-9 3-methyltransferase (glyoxalase superfamily)
MQKFVAFLMFEGQAEAAMNFYTSLFEGSKIDHIARYGAGEAGPEGSVMAATFSLGEQQFMASDSFVKHAFTFTPSISIWVNCESEAEIERAFAALSEGGAVLMPLDAYPFSKKFGWVQDRFGVSWQLTLVN